MDSSILNVVLIALAGVIPVSLLILGIQTLRIVPVSSETILNSLPDAVLVVDQRNRILALNTRAKDLLKRHTLDEIVGQPFERAFNAYLTSAGEEAKFATAHHWEVSVDGREWEIRLSPLQDRWQREKVRLVIFRNITRRKRAEQAQQEQQQVIQALQTSAALLNQTLDPDDVMQRILATVGQVVPHDSANIMLLDAETLTAQIRYQRGYPPEIMRLLTEKVYPLAEFKTLALMFETRQPLAVLDTLQTDYWVNQADVPVIRSHVGVPLQLEGAVIGFLNLDSQTPAALTLTDAQKLTAFADQAASAIRNARLYDQTRRQAESLNNRLEQLTMIQQVDEEISQLLEIEPLLALLMDTVIRLTHAHAGFIALMENGVLQVRQRYGGYAHVTLNPPWELPQAGIVSRVIRQQKAERVMEVNADPDYLPIIPTTKAQIVIPLVMQQQLIGVLNLETRHPHYFDEDSFQIMQILANRMAGSLQNARLHEKVQVQLAEQQRLYAEVSRLEQLKTDMIRVAAHDLGNPLGAIMGSLEILADELPDLDPQYQDFIHASRQSARRMRQIIKDILSLDRIQRMAEAKTMKNMNLMALLEEVLTEYTPRLAEKQLTLIRRYEPDLQAIILGDSVQLYEAIANLVSNAIKYTPHQGTVTVCLQQDEQEIRLEVQDTGYGIPLDQQGRLFQAFYRAYSPQTEAIEGTGLGLHLVKNIIERHGGEMFFQSTEGEGSTFGFTLYSFSPPIVEAIPA